MRNNSLMTLTGRFKVRVISDRNVGGVPLDLVVDNHDT